MLAARSYQVYLNGHLIHGFVWWQKQPFYQDILIHKNQESLLRKGDNILAIYANRTDRRGPAQLDASIDYLVPEGFTR